MASYSKTRTDFTAAGADAVGYGTDTFDSVRMSFAANLNKYYELSSCVLNPYIGYLYSRNKQESIDARTTAPVVWGPEFYPYFGQVRVGVNGYHSVGDQVELSAGVAYLQEITFDSGTSSNHSRDDDEVEGSLGVTFYVNDAFQIGLGGAMTFGRKNTDAYRAVINLSFAF